MNTLQIHAATNFHGGSFHNVNKTEKICGIYKIENKINQKIYVGQSINIMRRWAAHKIDAFNKKLSQKYKSALYSAIRKYGLQNFNFEILERCSKEDLNRRENYWIQYYCSNNPNFGYNLTSGGDNPPKTITKCYQYDLEGYFIKEFESVICASEETKTNKSSISRCCHGGIKSAGGYIWRLYKVEKIEEYSSEREIIPIYQYSKNGDLIKIYNSMSIASRLSGIDVSCICSCCSHDVKSAGGYVWRKEGDEFSYSNAQGNNRVALIIVNENGKIIHRFSSYTEAHNLTGIDKRTIKKLCITKNPDNDGNIWMKEEDYEKFY